MLPIIMMDKDSSNIENGGGLATMIIFINPIPAVN